MATPAIRNTLITIAAFISLILGLFFYSFFSVREMTAAQYEALGFYRFNVARPIAGFNLLDQQGRPVSHNDLVGHWSLLFFGFTWCPDVCPTTLAVLASATKTLQKKPHVVLVSVDPERDTPEALEQYLANFDPTFTGYTGEFDEIVKLATQVNIAFGKMPGPTPGTYTVDHSASIVVVDTSGKYAGFIKAPHDADRIASIMTSLMR